MVVFTCRITPGSHWAWRLTATLNMQFKWMKLYFTALIHFRFGPVPLVRCECKDRMLRPKSETNRREEVNQKEEGNHREKVTSLNKSVNLNTSRDGKCGQMWRRESMHFSFCNWWWCPCGLFRFLKCWNGTKTKQWKQVLQTFLVL